jgi:hypothetical protein
VGRCVGQWTWGVVFRCYYNIITTNFDLPPSLVSVSGLALALSSLSLVLMRQKFDEKPKAAPVISKAPTSEQKPFEVCMNINNIYIYII